MEKVRIIVIGLPNTGKTTIAHIIKAALDSHGFREVTIRDLPACADDKAPITERMRRTVERPVDIEVQLMPSKFSTEG